MISVKTAQKLKEAGLSWMPMLHDFFAVPERGLDHLTFVISDMTITVEMFGQYPVVTFNGASEWALDYEIGKVPYIGKPGSHSPADRAHITSRPAIVRRARRGRRGWHR